MLSNPDRSEAESLIALAQRRVRTLEGAKLYGKPIGSPIGEISDSGDASERPMTIERLKSLQRQFLAAQKANNTAVMKDIQEAFSKGFREYAEDHAVRDILDDLMSARSEETD